MHIYNSQGRPVLLRNKIRTFMVVLATLLALVSSTRSARAVTFSTSGGKILKDGSPFVVKGVNVQGANWYQNREITQDANLIANVWKFNTVRVCSRLAKTDTPWQQYTINNDLNKIVNEFTSRGVVVIFEAHDQTGGYFTNTTSPSITDLSNWFKNLAVTYKNNPYVWFNVMNEPGGQPYVENNGQDWLAVHQRIIKDIRDQGNNSIIICDGTSWGQDSGTWDASLNPGRSAILSYGTQLLNFGGSSYSNIVFSFHVYEQWGALNVFSSDAKIADYIQQVKNKGLTLVIGEYGSYNNSNTSPATNSMWKALQGTHSDVGRIAWEWDGGDSNDLTVWDPYFSWAGSGWGINKTDGTKPTNLTTLGSQIWDDNRTSAAQPISAADLVVTSVGIQGSSWNVGSTIRFTITVKNQGGTATSANWLGSYFYVDGTWVDWCGENATLGAGQSQTFVSKGWKATKTNFSLKGLADYPNYYPESNENNNDKTVVISR